MARFQVIRGGHRVNGQSLKPGAVIETNIDLATKFGRDKFMNLDQILPVQTQPITQQVVQQVTDPGTHATTSAGLRQSSEGTLDGYDKMPMGDLRKLAESLEIPFERTISKEELLKLVRGRQPVAA